MGDEQTRNKVAEKHQDLAADATPSDLAPEAMAAVSVPAEAPAAPLAVQGDEEATDSVFGEFMLFLKEEKKWWLAPIVIVLVLLGGILAFAEGSAIAPFIYTIF